MRRGAARWLGAGLALLGLAALACGGPDEEERWQLQQPVRLRFIQQPVDGRAGEALRPVVTVEVLDAEGQRVRGLETPVELRLPTRTSSGNLLGGSAMTHDGRATFPSLTILHVGAYELEALSSMGMQAHSRTFTIQPAAGGDVP